MKKFIIIGLGALLLVGAIFFVIQSGKKGATASEISSAPVTVAAKNGVVSIDVDGIALVEPYAQVTLRSSVSSVVQFVAPYGSTVRSGDPVVILADTQARNDVQQAEVALAQSEVDYQKALLASDRAAEDQTAKKALLDARAISVDEYTAAEVAAKNAVLALKAAELQVRKSKLSLDAARNNVADLRIKAPFDGTVLKTYVSAGDLVAPNTAVVLFGDVSRVRLSAEVDEYDIGKIQTGQRVSISGESIGTEPIVSTVEAISPMAEVVNNISIFKVTAVVDNTENRLRPGMSSDFSIRIASDKGMVVPSKSVSTVRGRSYIDVLENGEIVKKRVVAGADDGINTAILEGLEEGALVVVQGAAPAATVPAAATAEKSVLPITVPGTGGTK